MKLEFSGKIFEKSSNIKFHKNLSSCSMGMDRREEANNRSSQFCENASKNGLSILWLISQSNYLDL